MCTCPVSVTLCYLFSIFIPWQFHACVLWVLVILPPVFSHPHSLPNSRFFFIKLFLCMSFIDLNWSCLCEHGWGCPESRKFPRGFIIEINGSPLPEIYNYQWSFWQSWGLAGMFCIHDEMMIGLVLVKSYKYRSRYFMSAMAMAWSQCLAALLSILKLFTFFLSLLLQCSLVLEMGDTNVPLKALYPTVTYSLWFDQLCDCINLSSLYSAASLMKT